MLVMAPGASSLCPLAGQYLLERKRRSKRCRRGYRDCFPLSVLGLMLLYLFKRNVMAFFRLDSLNRIFVLVALIIAGLVIAIFLDPLRGPLGSMLGPMLESELP